MFFVTLAAAIVSIGYCSQQANFTAINNVVSILHVFPTLAEWVGRTIAIP
jgi:hypothetical protein